ncbi:MAG TPA: hypothetical protein VHB25_15770 [Gemmatimonadaceae bacterium]|nr:hypothetical protein [Gemmatimonadaceae bacterium]
MKTTTTLGFVALFATAVAGAAGAQNSAGAQGSSGTAAKGPDSTATAPAAAKKVSLYRPQEISNIRQNDQRGLNVFETPKSDTVPFTGFALSFGGAFNQEFQGLSHSNSATPVTVSGVNQNQLIRIGHGFNNAVANLNINAQLAPGIRVAMTSYLSARHHQETWVKDGFLQVDQSPIDNPLLNSIFKYTTVKVGHFEIDYGDSHYRRTDNGNGMDNAFVGNYILDAFTTEIGAEAIVQKSGLLAAVQATGGEVHGQVTAPQSRSMAVIGKLGFDKKLADNIRVRLTGSFYADNKAASNTLYTGDRGGGAYYDVLENTTSTEQNNAWSGQIRPGFSNKVNAEVVNPFVKIGGAEFFGNFETATGGSFAEPKLRTIHQNVYEGLYRFFDDKFYVGGRYNTVTGQMISKVYSDQDVKRYQIGGGWFVTPNILAKAEWINQKYNDFPSTDIRSGGQFKGFMVSGVVGF